MNWPNIHKTYASKQASEQASNVSLITKMLNCIASQAKRSPAAVPESAAAAPPCRAFVRPLQPCEPAGSCWQSQSADADLLVRHGARSAYCGVLFPHGAFQPAAA